MNIRWLFFYVGIISFIVLCAAYFLEYQYHLEPCSLCLLQRYLLWGIIFLFGLGVLHNPKRLGWILYSLVLNLFSLFGIVLAARHLWLQHLPPTSALPSCTAGLEKLLAYKPFLEALKTVLTEPGACAKMDFTILGFSLSFWTLLYFVGIFLFSFFIITLQIKRRI